MKDINDQIKVIKQAFDDSESIVRNYNKNYPSSTNTIPLANNLGQISLRLINLPFSKEGTDYAKQQYEKSQALSEKLQDRLNKYEKKLKAVDEVNPILTDEYTDAVLSGDTKTAKSLEAKARNAVKSKHTAKEKHNALLLPTTEANRQVGHWSRIFRAVEDSVLAQKIAKKDHEFETLLSQLKPLWSELNQLHNCSHSNIPVKHLDQMLETLNSNRIKRQLQEYFFEINSHRVLS